MKPINRDEWDNAKESTGFKKPAPGGYVCRITNVRDVESKGYFAILYDIADGEFAGHYAALEDAVEGGPRCWHGLGYVTPLSRRH